ncbi:MAG: nicotinate-nucleotide--dimethylbenzimidazole phosphoribosyltransferase [Coriobacteriia bacterium]|nr:nicotinate-nucleotide--dimethylbenzimidazole phosphoribosyltransferase [Coriobacteriia bacterium]
MTDDISSYELQLSTVTGSIVGTDPDAEIAAWKRLDSLTKPPRSLGRLEDIAARVARVQGTDRPSCGRKVIVVAAGDHGVVAEGVSPYPQDVTWQMVANFANGGAAINQIAASVGADVVVYDVGVACDVSHIEGVIVRKVAPGTANMALGPAMSREECAQAVLEGVSAARELAQRGYSLIGTGEMGIGNTTSASALTAVFAGAAAETVVGRGTGLDDSGVAHKTQVVSQAVLVNRATELDSLGVLSALGGYEIAALAGVMIGCAQERVVVVVDGFISGAAAMAAVALCPAVRDYLLPSHLSAEPGHAVQMEALGLRPVIELDMRLGEGTGAALAFALVDAACRVMSGMATFAEAGVSEQAQ